MADPIEMLDNKARALYDVYRAKAKADYRHEPAWEKSSNYVREEWREKALLSLRSKETLADELRREDRERGKIPLPPSGGRSPEGRANDG